jgi:hypothetical protein
MAWTQHILFLTHPSMRKMFRLHGQATLLPLQDRLLLRQGLSEIRMEEPPHRLRARNPRLLGARNAKHFQPSQPHPRILKPGFKQLFFFHFYLQLMRWHTDQRTDDGDGWVAIGKSGEA